MMITMMIMMMITMMIMMMITVMMTMINLLLMIIIDGEHYDGHNGDHDKVTGLL